MVDKQTRIFIYDCCVISSASREQQSNCNKERGKETVPLNIEMRPPDKDQEEVSMENMCLLSSGGVQLFPVNRYNSLIKCKHHQQTWLMWSGLVSCVHV